MLGPRRLATCAPVEHSIGSMPGSRSQDDRRKISRMTGKGGKGEEIMERIRLPSLQTVQRESSTSPGRQADTHAPDKGKMRLAKPPGIKELPQEGFVLFCARMSFSPYKPESRPLFVAFSLPNSFLQYLLCRDQLLEAGFCLLCDSTAHRKTFHVEMLNKYLLSSDILWR